MKFFITIFVFVIFRAVSSTPSNKTAVTTTSQSQIANQAETTTDGIVAMPLKHIKIIEKPPTYGSNLVRNRREPPFMIIRHRTKSFKPPSPKRHRKIKSPKPIYGPPNFDVGPPLNFYEPPAPHGESSFSPSIDSGHNFHSNSFDTNSADVSLHSIPSSMFDFSSLIKDSNSGSFYDTQPIPFDISSQHGFNLDSFSGGGSGGGSSHGSGGSGSSGGGSYHETPPPQEPYPSSHHTFSPPKKSHSAPQYSYSPPEHSYPAPPQQDKHVPHAIYGVPPPVNDIHQPSYHYQASEISKQDFSPHKPKRQKYFTEPVAPPPPSPTHSFHDQPPPHSPPSGQNYQPPPKQHNNNQGSYSNQNHNQNSNIFDSVDLGGYFAEPPPVNSTSHWSSIPAPNFPLDTNDKQHYDSPKTSYEVPLYEAVPFDDASSKHENYPPITQNSNQQNDGHQVAKGSKRVEIKSPPRRKQKNSSSTSTTGFHTLSASLEELGEPPADFLDELAATTTTKRPRISRKRTRVPAVGIPKRHNLDTDELKDAFNSGVGPSFDSRLPRIQQVRRRENTEDNLEEGTEKNYVLLSAQNDKPKKKRKSYRNWESKRINGNKMDEDFPTTPEQSSDVNIISVQKSESHSFYDGTLAPQALQQTRQQPFGPIYVQGRQE